LPTSRFEEENLQLIEANRSQHLEKESQRKYNCLVQMKTRSESKITQRVKATRPLPPADPRRTRTTAWLRTAMRERGETGSSVLPKAVTSMRELFDSMQQLYSTLHAARPRKGEIGNETSGLLSRKAL
jgi:hypothetical protein